MGNIFKDVDVKFILRINGEDIEVPAGIMAALASNTSAYLNYFLSGFLKRFPTDKDILVLDDPWFKFEKGDIDG